MYKKTEEQLLKLPHLRKLNILYSFEETFIFFI